MAAEQEMAAVQSSRLAGVRVFCTLQYLRVRRVIAPAYRRVRNGLIKGRRGREIENERVDALDEFIARDLSSQYSDYTDDDGKTPPMIVFDDAPFRICWDLLMGSLIIFYVIVVPLRMAFGNTASSDFITTRGRWYYFDLVADLGFLLDIA
jgi:hypothetical protein